MSQITPSTTMPPRVQVPMGPGTPPPAGSGTSLTMNDIIAMLKRRIVLIIIVFLLVLGLSIAGTFVWAMYWPSYRATSYLKVDSPDIPDPFEFSPRAVNPQIYEQYLNTQARRLVQIGILAKAIERPEVRNTNWFEQYAVPGSPGTYDIDEALNDLQDDISAGAVRDTQYITVSFSYRVAKDTPVIVNAVVDTFLKETRDQTEEQLRQEGEKLRTTVENLRTEVQNLESSIALYVEQYDIPTMRGQQVEVLQRVMLFTDRLAEASVQLEESQNTYDSFTQRQQSLDSQGFDPGPMIRQQVEMDPLIRQYNMQKADLETSLNVARNKLGNNHPQIEQIADQLDEVSRRLNQRRNQRTTEMLDQFTQDAEMRYNSALKVQLTLSEDLAEARAELNALQSRINEYERMQRQFEDSRERLQTLEDQLRRFDMTRESERVVRVSPEQRALMPTERSSPKMIINVAGGIVLGAGIAIGLALLLELVSTRIRTPADIVRQLNLPLLGQVPASEDDRGSPEDLHQAMLTAPHSMFSESFRQVRANLLYCSPAEQQRTVAVTSCSPSCGKTTIAINLAYALAMAGKKILLVDANFRRPTLQKTFDLKDQSELRHGFSTVLVGQSQAANEIVNVQPNLDVMPAGPLPPNPAELLSDQYLRPFIDILSEQYDKIIFDCPPLLVVSDALVLTTTVDGVVLVVRANSTRRGVVGRARELLRKANARLLGVVLNDVQITRGGYFRKAYQTYYDYQGQGGELAEAVVGDDDTDNISDNDK